MVMDTVHKTFIFALSSLHMLIKKLPLDISYEKHVAFANVLPIPSQCLTQTLRALYWEVTKGNR